VVRRQMGHMPPGTAKGGAKRGYGIFATKIYKNYVISVKAWKDKSYS